MSGNGEVIEIGDFGLTPFRFKFPPATANGEAGYLDVTLDVIEVGDKLNDLIWKFADKDGKVVQEKASEFREAQKELVRGILNEATQGKAQDLVIRLNNAQLGAFISQVSKKVKELQPFFSTDSGGERSPGPSSDVTYST